MKTAIITGISGQDGSYLTEQLLADGYHVHGLAVGIEDFSNIDHLLGNPQLTIVHGELMDQAFLFDWIGGLCPDRIFNLAGQSYVPLSWKQPVFTCDFNGLSIARILEAIRITSPKTRFYQASSSEMYGDSLENAANEKTGFRPCSPYAAAKVLGHHLVNVYRESYGLFACSGILFNHESHRRGKEFVTQKIAHAVARIVSGDRTPLRLGANSRRDWGHASDYVRAMRMMLDYERPDDYVICSGNARSVYDFCRLAFEYAGVQKWEQHVEFDCPEFMRPKDVGYLEGDCSKAREILGWRPEFTFRFLVREMVDAAVLEVAK